VNAEPRPVADGALIARFPEEWMAALVELGEPKYRAQQIFRWLMQRGVFDPAKMTDLSGRLREKLGASGVASPGEVVGVRRSQDGTRKLLLGFREDARVECVLIPMTDLDADAAAAVEDETADEDVAVDTGAREPTPVTLCVSSQFGCAMGCRFCASGQAGLLRGLKAAEIVYQVLVAREHLGEGEQLKNLVFMGMGEPLHHYDETVRALRLLMHPDGLNISPRRITVSTVGLVPGIRRLGQDFEGKIGLAVSLHAPNDAIRSQIMPMNERYPIAELMDTLRAYPLPRRRRITIEYTLIDGVNDAPEHARELGRLLRGLPVKINLIPMNPIANSRFLAPAHARVAEFQRELADAGYSCFVRTRRGDEVDAACGQLALSSDLVRKRLARGES
jgi:23S rRNA (adenine2503-C2)-methyltransferase